MLKNAAISGWGRYLPQKVLTNEELAATLGTDPQWILTRTGIRERHIAAADETTSSMCVHAARQALERADLDALDVDLVLCATTTPDHLVPATACLVQREIGATRAGAFDINSACCGFVTALTVASQFIRAGTCQRVLVVAGEMLSRFTDWQDRSTCVLFGDGASAVVLESTAQDAGVVSSVLGCRGDVERLLTIEAGGSARPATAQTLAAGTHKLRMRGNEIFKLAVRAMKEAATEALARAGLTTNDLRVIIPHQANERIITATQEALGLDRDRVFVNIDRCANTGSTSVGIALDDYLSRASLEPGEHALLVAFGGGLTWAAAVVRWADVELLHAQREGCLRSSTRGVPTLPMPRVLEDVVVRSAAG